MADEDVEIAHVERGVQALVAAAEEHENHGGCPSTEQHVCWDNRYHLVAKVMHALGCELLDIGYIAASLMDLEREVADAADPAPEAEAFSSDDVLNVE